MFERVKRLYLTGMSDTGLDRAVTFGWITEEQKQEIINSKTTTE